MRILLISANQEPFPEPVFPLGAVYVADALIRSGAAVRIFDLRYHSSLSALRNVLSAYQPDRIGISLRNIDNAAYPATRYYLPSYASLIKKIRSISNAPIILGGSAFSLFPDETLDYLGADAGIVGEGENTYEFFLQPEGRERIMRTGPLPMERVSFPGNIDALFSEFRRYRTIGIQTARGCPNQCIYCTYPCLEGRTRRSRDPDLVADELAMMYRNFGLKHFFIVDSVFNADEDHMVRVLDAIRHRNLPITFSCYLQPRISDIGLFGLLKSAGCVAVDFGTDAGSSEMLHSYRKPFTTDDIRAVSLGCKKAGLDFSHSLILGGPAESRKTISETIALMREVAPRAVLAMTGVRIYPGTELADIAIREGLLSTSDSLLQPRFYFSPLGVEAILRAAYEGTSSQRNWFFPGKKDWSSTIGYRIVNFFFRNGPAWRIFRS